MNANASRYQPGGDLYETVSGQYGAAAANVVAQAARSDDRTAVSTALGQIRNGAYSTQTSTWGNFFDQITTDPLAAPLESANNQIGKGVWNVVKNPFVLGVVILAVVGLFMYFGGWRAIRKHITG